MRILSCLFGRRELSIADKLGKAAEAVPRLRKTGKHPASASSEEYNYLRVKEVADAFWAELRKQGLIAIPNDIECGFLDSNNAWVKTEFVVDDGKLEKRYASFGQGFSHEGHALHIAQSTALKSWLKRLGMTFGEEDDQEISVSPYTPPQYEVEGVKRFQERVWAAALQNSGLTNQQVEAHLSTEFGERVTAEQITSLSPERFDVAVKLIRNTDLIASMEASTRTAKAKKNGKGPQAVVNTLDKKAPDEIATA